MPPFQSLPTLTIAGRSLSRWAVRRGGFTLVEVLIVVTIIGLLASIAVPQILRSIAAARVTRAINDLRVIGQEIENYESANGVTPVDLSVISRAGFTDPWGRPYVYYSFDAAGPSWKGAARKDHSLVPLNSSFDLYSMGADGKTAAPLTAAASQDDIVRANDGGFIGLGAEF